MSLDAVTLEVVRNGLAAVAEEMNANLVRTAYSPNIKERRDCSSAVFDATGDMLSQADSIPVHLGAMPFSVAAAIKAYPPDTLAPGDGILLNDPFNGGAHLPDVTLVSPAYVDGDLVGFAANRAHHADIGGATPGSVTAGSTEIYEEGIRFPPVRAVRSGAFVPEFMDVFLANARAPRERRGDLRAQLAANHTGIDRLASLVDAHGLGTIGEATEAIPDYAERRMRAEIEELPDGTASYSDVIEDDGHGNADCPIRATVSIEGDTLQVDFTGSAVQSPGAVNAVRAVTVSATYYAVRALTDPDVPANVGSSRPISVDAPPGTIVNAEPPAAVVGGNLEVSQRIVDAVLGAFAEVAPERVPAASQGTMNNVTFGGSDPETGEAFTFYETQPGGSGAINGSDGTDGVQIHMTNTRNTPAEVIETSYPLRVRRYALRPDSGGAGTWRGGLGVRRDIEVLAPCTCSLLAERRRIGPYGIAGGASGEPGEDVIIEPDGERTVPPKSTHELSPGTVVSIRSPGGGGYGTPEEREAAAIERDLTIGTLTLDEAVRAYDWDVQP